MRADNDNRKHITHDPFVGLPLFATDKEIAKALVGATRADKWLREVFPTLASKTGFPQVDKIHGGRAVPLVKLYYSQYLGLNTAIPGSAPEGETRLGQWNGRQKRRLA